MITVSGNLQFYFNRHKDAPYVWCLRAGEDPARGWCGVDICITQFLVRDLHVRSFYRPLPEGAERAEIAQAWVGVVGTAYIDENTGICEVEPSHVRSVRQLPDGAGIVVDLGGGREHRVAATTLETLGFVMPAHEKVKITDIGVLEVKLHPSRYYIVKLQDGACINVPEDMVANAKWMR